jgi:hypothetical protein
LKIYFVIYGRNILDNNNNNKSALGRWSINYCNNNINKKIDSGNEDHCGPCGQYSLKQVEKNIKTNHKQIEIIKKNS